MHRFKLKKPKKQKKDFILDTPNNSLICPCGEVYKIPEGPPSAPFTCPCGRSGTLAKAVDIRDLPEGPHATPEMEDVHDMSSLSPSHVRPSSQFGYAAETTYPNTSSAGDDLDSIVTTTPVRQDNPELAAAEALPHPGTPYRLEPPQEAQSAHHGGPPNNSVWTSQLQDIGDKFDRMFQFMASQAQINKDGQNHLQERVATTELRVSHQIEDVKQAILAAASAEPKSAAHPTTSNPSQITQPGPQISYSHEGIDSLETEYKIFCENRDKFFSYAENNSIIDLRIEKYCQELINSCDRVMELLRKNAPLLDLETLIVRFNECSELKSEILEVAKENPIFQNSFWFLYLDKMVTISLDRFLEQYKLELGGKHTLNSFIDPQRETSAVSSNFVLSSSIPIRYITYPLKKQYVYFQLIEEHQKFICVAEVIDNDYFPDLILGQDFLDRNELELVISLEYYRFELATVETSHEYSIAEISQSDFKIESACTFEEENYSVNFVEEFSPESVKECFIDDSLIQECELLQNEQYEIVYEDEENFSQEQVITHVEEECLIECVPENSVEICYEVDYVENPKFDLVNEEIILEEFISPQEIYEIEECIVNNPKAYSEKESTYMNEVQIVKAYSDFHSTDENSPVLLINSSENNFKTKLLNNCELTYLIAVLMLILAAFIKLSQRTGKNPNEIFEISKMFDSTDRLTINSENLAIASGLKGQLRNILHLYRAYYHFPLKNLIIW